MFVKWFSCEFGNHGLFFFVVLGEYLLLANGFSTATAVQIKMGMLLQWKVSLCFERVLRWKNSKQLSGLVVCVSLGFMSLLYNIFFIIIKRSSGFESLCLVAHQLSFNHISRSVLSITLCMRLCKPSVNHVSIATLVASLLRVGGVWLCFTTSDHYHLMSGNQKWGICGRVLLFTGLHYLWKFVSGPFPFFYSVYFTLWPCFLFFFSMPVVHCKHLCACVCVCVWLYICTDRLCRFITLSAWCYTYKTCQNEK